MKMVKRMMACALLFGSIGYAQVVNVQILLPQQSLVESNTIVELVGSTVQYPVTIDLGSRSKNIFILTCIKPDAVKIISNDKITFEVNPQFWRDMKIVDGTIFCPNIFDTRVVDISNVRFSNIIWYQQL